jgi:hypothetical protein
MHVLGGIILAAGKHPCPQGKHSTAHTTRVGGSQVGESFEAGARAEREQELMNRVSHDLNEMEGFMHGGHGHRERRARHRGDGSSFIPKAWRKSLKEDVRQVGDRLVPVTGQPVNLDLI